MNALTHFVSFALLLWIVQANTAEYFDEGSEELRQDAACYAERYPDLLEGFCEGDHEACDVEGLWEHYNNDGRTAELIWGCRNRDVVHAQAVAYTEFEEELPNLHVLVFETDPDKATEMKLFAQSLAAGIELTVFGVSTKFEGFGTKWEVVKPVLEELALQDDRQLVAIVDGRDVLLNIHKEDPRQGRDIVEGFALSYQALTVEHPNAVVMSTEGQCCVSALTFAKPGDYFDSTGQRMERACASGEEGCLWNGDARTLPWEDFQHSLAEERTGLNLADVYLNAGLVAGRPYDLLRVIETADMLPSEDDQAVFTDYMYNFPNEIVLDYAQQMFGNARWTHGMTSSGCPFDRSPSLSPGSLIHKETKTTPLFLHGPGKFFECLDFVAERIGHGDEDGADEGSFLNSFLRAGGAHSDDEDAEQRELWSRNYGGKKKKWHRVLASKNYGGKKKGHRVLASKNYGGKKKWHRVLASKNYGGKKKGHRVLASKNYGGKKKWFWN